MPRESARADGAMTNDRRIPTSAGNRGLSACPGAAHRRMGCSHAARPSCGEMATRARGVDAGWARLVQCCLDVTRLRSSAASYSAHWCLAQWRTQRKRCVAALSCHSRMEYASRVTSPTLLLSTDDRFEGANAFKEKRAP